MNFTIFDLFGSQIGLRYLDQEQYKTHFGTWVSILIGILIAIQAIISSQELFTKQNPEVISAERFVAFPERFNLKKDNFNFAFGAQFPGNYSHFIDETIYTVSAEQLNMKKILNEQTQQYEQQWTSIPLTVRPCKMEYFGVEKTKQYFEALSGLEQMYCINQESDDLYFEGNFDQDSFGHVVIKLQMCTGSPHCRDSEDIKRILTNSFVALYSNDVIINSKNIDPFTVVARDFFWNTSPIFSKQVTMNFRNAYVESDEGIFFEDKSYQRGTVHSYQDQQLIMRFEKAKESVYHRKYKKLDSVLAEIGGIAKVLMVLGLFISLPINKLAFSQQVSNQLFKFKASEKQQEQNEEGKQQQQKHLSNKDKIEEAKEMDCLKQQTPMDSLETNKNLNTIRFDQLQSSNPFQQVQKQMENSYDNNLISSQFRNGIFLNNDKKNVSQLLDEETERRQKNKSLSNNVESNKSQESQIDEALPVQQERTKKLSTSHLQSRKLQYLSQKKASSQFGTNLSKFFDIQSELTESIQNSKRIFQPHSSESPDINRNDLKTAQNDRNNRQRKLSKFGQTENDNEEESLQLKWSDYIKYYIWPFGEFKKKKKLIEYSTQKVYQHLDMIYIIQKLLELEKLKSILLDEDQISLIQFLPKPQIDINNLNIRLINPNHSFKRRKSINLLNDIVPTNEKENAKAAFLALRNILKKKTLSNIDKNIIEMLDYQTLDNIQNNIEYLRSLVQDNKQKQEGEQGQQCQSPQNDGLQLLTKDKSNQGANLQDIIMETSKIGDNNDSQFSQNYPSSERESNIGQGFNQQNSSGNINSNIPIFSAKKMNSSKNNKPVV